MSSRDDCRNTILLIFHDEEMGFEEIVRKVGSKFSRGTVNKYLQKLCDEGLVKQAVKRGPRPYHLTARGKEKVSKLSVIKYAVNIMSQKPEKIKVALEELQKIIGEGLEVYSQDQQGFFSCVADVAAKTGFLTIPKQPTPKEQETPFIKEPRKRYLVNNENSTNAVESI